jgi:hypothetical protein
MDYSANPSMASTTLDSLPTDMDQNNHRTLTNSCMIAQKTIDNMVSMNQTSSGMSFECVMGSNVPSTSTSSFQSMDVGQIQQQQQQVQVPASVFKTETMDMSLTVSTAIPSSNTSSVNPVSLHSHTIPVNELSSFENFYPNNAGPSSTQESFQTSYGSNNTAHSINSNQNIPVYEQSHTVSQRNMSDNTSSMHLQSNMQTNITEYHQQLQTPVSVQVTCTFSGQKSSVTPTTNIPIDLSSFQTEVRRDDSHLGDQSSTSSAAFCSNIATPSTTTIVECNPVSVAGMATPQAIQSINVMTQMTDNELLGFINPSTFD